jgi:hypothetical protein
LRQQNRFPDVKELKEASMINQQTLCLPEEINFLVGVPILGVFGDVKGGQDASLCRLFQSFSEVR